MYVALAQEFLHLAMEHLNIAAKPRLNIAAFGGVSTPSAASLNCQILGSSILQILIEFENVRDYHSFPTPVFSQTTLLWV